MSRPAYLGTQICAAGQQECAARCEQSSSTEQQAPQLEIPREFTRSRLGLYQTGSHGCGFSLSESLRRHRWCAGVCTSPR